MKKTNYRKRSSTFTPKVSDTQITVKNQPEVKVDTLVKKPRYQQSFTQRIKSLESKLKIMEPVLKTCFYQNTVSPQNEWTAMALLYRVSCAAERECVGDYMHVNSI